MKITAETKVHDLLETYPHLKAWLIAYAPEFAKLNNPVVYNTVGRFATLETAASMANQGLDRFLDDVRAAVARATIVAEESASDTEPQLDEDEASRKQELLKGLIQRLHDGESVDDVKTDFDRLVDGIDSAEIARMEQALIAEGMPVEEVMRLCDVHVTVFKEALEEKPDAEVATTHPVAAYQRENAALTQLTGRIRESLEALETEQDSAIARIVDELEELAQIDVHYTRKENQLFPALEAHGVEGPTKVMWGLDDDIRARIKNARALAASADAGALALELPETLTMVDDMVYKEEKILFPTALQVVTSAEWEQIAAGDPEIGYAWVEGPEGEAGRGAAVASTPQATEAGELMLPLVTGSLTVDQLNIMLGVLPFDISFVDENDRVRFYSEGERVFPRSPGAIGREVRNCHPPKSLEKVEEILAAFKAGEKEVAEFWIEMGPKFIHIRYFAMRDADGAYRGCLEVVQDATAVRALTGQRRIVDW